MNSSTPLSTSPSLEALVAEAQRQGLLQGYADLNEQVALTINGISMTLPPGRAERVLRQMLTVADTCDRIQQSARVQPAPTVQRVAP